MNKSVIALVVVAAVAGGALYYANGQAENAIKQQVAQANQSYRDAANSGLIITMGSIAGTVPYPGGNVYGGTKAFVKQFSLNLRADLAGSKVRVSNIEPGLCSGTEFSLVRLDGDADAVNALYQDVEAIRPEDIAHTVSWISQLP